MKIEKAVETLKVYIGKGSIKKINSQKYEIETKLIHLGSLDPLKIYLVELNEKLYFADYGYILNEFNSPKLSEDKFKFLYNFLQKSKINFENNERLFMETNDEKIVFDYNLFVIGISILQSILVDF